MQSKCSNQLSFLIHPACLYNIFSCSLLYLFQSGLFLYLSLSPSSLSLFSSYLCSLERAKELDCEERRKGAGRAGNGCYCCCEVGRSVGQSTVGLKSPNRPRWGALVHCWRGKDISGSCSTDQTQVKSLARTCTERERQKKEEREKERKSEREREREREGEGESFSERKEE
jgi:hypothetical protein